MAKFVHSRFHKWRRWLLDLALVNLILAAATFGYMRYLGMTPILFTDRGLYLFWHAMVSILVLVPMAYIGEYGVNRAARTAKAVFSTLGVSFLTLFALSFFFQEQVFSRVVFALAGLLSIFSLTAWRFLSIQGGKVIAKIMDGTKRVAIIGDDERALALSELIQGERLEGYEFVGFIGLDPRRMLPEMRQNLIGDLSTLASVAQKAEVHGVIIALGEGAFQTAVKVLAEKPARGLEVKLLVGDPVPGQMSLVDLNFDR